jgi:hypothetical protein
MTSPLDSSKETICVGFVGDDKLIGRSIGLCVPS